MSGGVELQHIRHRGDYPPTYDETLEKNGHRAYANVGFKHSDEVSIYVCHILLQ